MGTKARILIIDDNKDLCLNLTDIFEDMGYFVHSVNSAGAAVEEVKAQNYDLSLIDVKLPDLTGNELLARLRKISPNLAAIMITGHATTESAIQALNEGASAYILKPLEMEQVAAIVEQTIEKLILQKKLEEFETRNKSLFENTHDAIFILDAESGKIIEANRRSEELTGYSEEDLLSMVGTDLQIPEERHLIADALQGKSEYSGIFNDVSILTKDGKRILTDVEITMVSFGERKIIQANVRDITKKKLLQEHLFQTAKLLTIGRMAAGIAHQINNPLTGVMGFTQLLLNRDLDPKVRDYLEKIRAESERAAKVAQTMLSFARENKSKRYYADINEAIESVVELKLYDFTKSGIKIVTELYPGISQSMFDFQRMQQVFLNIITNAEQAMEESKCGDTLKITTEEFSENDPKDSYVGDTTPQRWIKIIFSDNGPGISPENLEHIFDPFFTTREGDKGVGLGLSTCFVVIHEHGGSITAESVEGEGASFIIKLPITTEIRNCQIWNEKANRG